ncbi:MAG: hypothetical protein IRY94_20625 [Rhodospirillaceae bacterium]|nr:hypothetical protein [Rhodospirillaceae bacterium]
MSDWIVWALPSWVLLSAIVSLAVGRAIARTDAQPAGGAAARGVSYRRSRRAC